MDSNLVTYGLLIKLMENTILHTIEIIKQMIKISMNNVDELGFSNEAFDQVSNIAKKG